MGKTNLQRLYTEQGQAPWLDNISRGLITLMLQDISDAADRFHAVYEGMNVNILVHGMPHGYVNPHISIDVSHRTWSAPGGFDCRGRADRWSSTRTQCVEPSDEEYSGNGSA